jgi:hypothetical protein
MSKKLSPIIKFKYAHYSFFPESNLHSCNTFQSDSKLCHINERVNGSNTISVLISLCIFILLMQQASTFKNFSIVYISQFPYITEVFQGVVTLVLPTLLRVKLILKSLLLASCLPCMGC